MLKIKHIKFVGTVLRLTDIQFNLVVCLLVLISQSVYDFSSLFQGKITPVSEALTIKL